MAKEPVFCTWDGQSLKPKTARDLEIMQRFKLGGEVRFEPTCPRNPRRHALYWCVLTVVVDATGCTPTTDHLHDLIKLKTGYARASVLPNGEIVYVPDSIAWNKMSEDEFKVFLDEALKWIAETFGITAEEIQREAA